MKNETKPDKFFFVLPIDEGQSINVLDHPDEKYPATLGLPKPTIFVGKHDCIHGGSSYTGLRLHGMFVPADDNEPDSTESQTHFLLSDIF